MWSSNNSYFNLYWSLFMVMDWKTRKIKAINKLSKKKGWSSNDNNPYFYLVHEIYKTKATTPKQFKEEQNGHK